MITIWFSFYGESGCVGATKVEVFGVDKARVVYDTLEANDKIIMRSVRP